MEVIVVIMKTTRSNSMIVKPRAERRVDGWRMALPFQ
jgi:hypothetical protein